MEEKDLFDIYVELMEDVRDLVVTHTTSVNAAVELQFAFSDLFCNEIIPLIKEARERADRKDHLYLGMCESIDRLENKLKAIQHKVISTCKKCNGSGVLLDKEHSTPHDPVMKACHKCVERVTITEATE